MQALADNRRIRPDEIAVEARDGEVTLRGTVGSIVQRTEAARAARRVLGVRDVDDQLGCG
jgi:osmotically-inducible protein OsmY